MNRQNLDASKGFRVVKSVAVDMDTTRYDFLIDWQTTLVIPNEELVDYGPSAEKEIIARGMDELINGIEANIAAYKESLKSQGE